MKNIKHKIIIISIIAIAVIGLLILFMYLSQKKAPVTPTPVTTTKPLPAATASGKSPIILPVPIAITNSTPANNSSGVGVFDPITITFNQTVDPLSVTITSNPSEDWHVSQTAPNTIKVDHSLYLRVATPYKLTISQHGKTVGTLSFETAHEQNDPRQLQILQSDLNKNYPLATLTPYETANYRVVYSSPLTFEIQLKGSMSAQSAISEVQAWVKSNGIDPATHKYIVVSPSPTP